MTDILEEVLRDQSYEKKVYYFKKALPVVILITILSVIAMLIFSWYMGTRAQHNMQMGDMLIKSMDNLILEKSVDSKLIQQSLDNLVTKNNNRVREIAALKQVNLKIAVKDYDSAKVLLEKIIDNENYYETTTAYARIVWLGLVIDQKKIVASDKSKLQKYLQYFSNETKEFFGTASIIKAIWHIRNEEPESALNVLKAVMALHTTPQIIKEQAKALLSKIE
ncbi:DUF2659 family protein [Candidatus Trichorickettsia mobilis]|jgi:hypothetical protein|uniref:DUF2659 family protein n=1 Tax=Candidatus Trichorickettsia mobilis TaxID=1346319 RepID=UPI0029319ED0|nr:DUF2659 family protein [Candidatus Trichorickettsia mobilis]